MTDTPQDGEWWVCCWAEAVEHFGGKIENVPVDQRLVAYYQKFPSCEPWWCVSGDPDVSRAHWLTPIRKVDLA